MPHHCRRIELRPLVLSVARGLCDRRAMKTKPKKVAKRKQTAAVKVDPAMKKKWLELSHVIDQAKRKEAFDWDALWEAVGHVVEHEPPLYTVGNFKNAKDYYQRSLKESVRTASRNIRVAKFASPNEEVKHGVAKLDAALAFIEAKVGAPLAHPPLPIAFEKLRFVTGEGKHISFAEARVEDIVSATRALTKKGNAPTSSAERALIATFSKHPAFKTVRVRVRNGLATLTGVPVASLEVLGTLLHRTKWPAAKK